MKRLFLIMAILAILITTVFASQNDPRIPLSLNGKHGNFRTVKQNDRFMPTYTFAIEPLSIMDNMYDYFPGSFAERPIQRGLSYGLDGNWLLFQSKPTHNSSRKVYNAFIKDNGTLSNFDAFDYEQDRCGFPSMAITEGGRPILAYHVANDENPALNVVFGYAGAHEGSMPLNSDPYTLIENPYNIEVDGQTYSNNEFIWPSVQIGPSPVAGSERVYIMGRNATVNGSGDSENVVIYYRDFTEEDIKHEYLDNSGWSVTTIPQLNEWNVATNEWRRPFMSFIVHNDKLYYIGYHTAFTEAGTAGSPLQEGRTTAFICDNYGEGTWTQHSIYNEFAIANPNKIDPHTGEVIPSTGIFQDANNTPYDDEFLRMGIGQSSKFSTSIDNEGRIHFPAFYTVQTTDGGEWIDYHTVKQIAFDTNNLSWEVAEVYPQLDNGTDIPNPPLNITNYDGANNGTNAGNIWLSWDQDGDGLYEQVYDDGTWDGIDDGITSDSALWGVPVRDNKWPYMYWDSQAADNAMMHHLHTAHITDGNEHGMMAMIWQDSQKSKNYNEYPDEYPELADYQNMCELVISVSNDNGRHWSAPIFLNGVDTPEMQGHIPEFPYLSNDVDYIGVDNEGNRIGRVYIMYLNDSTYGSSVHNIGQATVGSMEYMALDIVFPPLPVDNINNDVVPSISMLSQNYPNPFNPETRINFNVVKSGNVELSIYNVKGQLVKTLVDANKTVGSHNVVWQGDDNNGRKVSSGVYFYRVSNGGRSEMKKMVLMK